MSAWCMLSIAIQTIETMEYMIFLNYLLIFPSSPATFSDKEVHFVTAQYCIWMGFIILF